ANILQEKLGEELAKGTKAGLAQQLSEALLEADEAREKLRTMERTSENNTSEDIDPTVTIKEQKDAMQTLSPEKRKNLTDILVTSGAITQEQIQKAQTKQRNQPDATLTGILLSSDMINEEVLAEAISLQSGIPILPISETTIDVKTVQELPERIARMYCCIILNSSSNQLDVAMANPGNLLAIEDIERVTGKQVSPSIALRSEIEEAIEKYYLNP
ncbi:MAG: hypothetical protein KAH38_10295, partial [Candidatus Hydrogenedentes bacterium]|nr:hypothetical protein [Candidatus Hydrogenedentota bacterium]